MAGESVVSQTQTFDYRLCMSGCEAITVAIELLTGYVAGQHLDQRCQFLTGITLVHAALR
jgi:hypothetical protein